MINVAEIEQLLKMIEELRNYIHTLIDNKNNILDPEILAASKMLDVLLNEYARQLKGKEQGK